MLKKLKKLKKLTILLEVLLTGRKRNTTCQSGTKAE